MRFFIRTALLTLISLLLSSGLLHAETLITNQEQHQQLLAPYIHTYFDTKRSLEISDITNQHNNLRWSNSGAMPLNFGFSDAAIWLKATLSNPSNKPIKKLIELPYSLIDNVEFYHLNSQGRLLANYIMGSEIRFNSRPIPHHNFVIPLTLAANSNSKIFLRLTGQHSLQAPMTLWSTERFLTISRLENWLNFGYFTLLFGLMAYALYRLSPQPRIRRYIYPGMVITPLLALLTIEGYAFQYLWPEHPAWNSVGLATLIPGSLTFLSLYLYIIFSKIAINDRFHHALLPLAVGNILLLTAPILIDYSLALALDLCATIVYGCLLIYLSARHWHRLSRPNKATLFGFFWLSLSALIFTLEITHIIPSFPVIETPLQVGFFLFVFSLFWAQLNVYARLISIFKGKRGNKSPKKNADDDDNVALQCDVST